MEHRETLFEPQKAVVSIYEDQRLCQVYTFMRIPKTLYEIYDSSFDGPVNIDLIYHSIGDKDILTKAGSLVYDMKGLLPGLSLKLLGIPHTR